MKQHYSGLSWLALLLLVAGLASCSTSSSDDSEYTQAAYVSNVNLGSLRCLRHATTDSGADSLYYASIVGSLYPMHIDQAAGRIYNADSLPVGTDAQKVVFTDFSYVGATMTIKSLTTGNDTAFVLTDSTDFSAPRTVTVYAFTEEGYVERPYKVEINVHQQNGEEYAWPVAATVPELAALSNVKAALCGSTLAIFGMEGAVPVVLTAQATSSPEWMRTPLGATDINVESVVAMGTQYYALSSSGNLQTSTDAVNWTAATAPAPFEALAVVGNQMLAVSEGKLYASSDGSTWEEQPLDEDAPLPNSPLAVVSLPSRTNSNYTCLVLAGLSGGEAAVWKRDVDQKGINIFDWNYLPQNSDVAKPYPVSLAHTSLIAYDGEVRLYGLNAEGGLEQPYASNDYGRQWTQAGNMLPAQADAANSLSVLVDGENYIWICCGGSGQVWRGRPYKMGWDNMPAVYKKPRK